MKKIIFLFLAVMAIMSCSTSKNLTNDPYSAEATAFSTFSQDDAYQNAYMVAMGKICDRFHLDIETTAKQDYHNTMYGKKISENSTTHRTIRTEGRATAEDIVVTKTKYQHVGAKYYCTVVVSISPENLK